MEKNNQGFTIIHYFQATDYMQVFNNEYIRKQCLDLLRFPLAIVVVICHVFTTKNINSVEQYPIFIELNKFIDAFLRGISVPVYFLISGYVFFLCERFDKQTYSNKLKNRIKSLLIPYLIWNTIAILMVIIKEIPIFSSFLSHPNVDLDLSIKNILSAYWKYDGSLNPVDIERTNFPINTALWFIRDLMIIVITTPIIYQGIKRLKEFYIIPLGILYLISYYAGRHTMIISAYFFFSWGAYMSVQGVDFIKLSKRYGLISIVIYLLCSTTYLGTIDYKWITTTCKLISTIVFPIAAFYIAQYLIINKKIKNSVFLSSGSFFIYITHCLLVHRVTKVLFMLIRPSSDIEVCTTYMLSCVTTISVLLFSFYILRKYCPRLLKVVAGRK